MSTCPRRRGTLSVARLRLTPTSMAARPSRSSFGIRLPGRRAATSGFCGTYAMLLAVLAAAQAPAHDLQPELRRFLSDAMRFTRSELADLQNGRVVVRGLEATSPAEVGVVGAVRVRTHRSRFVDQYRDIVQFKKGPGVLQIG